MSFLTTLADCRNRTTVYLHDFLLSNHGRTDHVFFSRDLHTPFEAQLPKPQNGGFRTYKVKNEATLRRLVERVIPRLNKPSRGFWLMARKEKATLKKEGFKTGNIRLVVTQEQDCPVFDSEKAWAEANERRLNLIDRKYAEGLTKSEAEDLKQLQQATGQFLNQRHPLSFDLLKQMEREIEG